MYFVEKIIDKIQLNDSLPSNFDIDNSLFFDIETSGLSPKTSFVFLIGLMFYQNEKFIVRQYFANCIDEELEILNNFIQDIDSFKKIYHYNGLSFDIPYLNTRLQKHNVNYKIPKETSFDIYQHIRKNNTSLGIENLKLKSVEKFLGIYREDDLSGKQVVDSYIEFTESKNFNLRDKILLHNIEDIINLYRILPIINILNVGKIDNFELIDYKINVYDKKLIITGNISGNTKLKQKVNNNNFMLTSSDDFKNFKLEFKIFEGLLYYHIKDYKNYYYVEDVDCAIHKSVIKFYNYNNKEFAKKSNCYTKQISKYIKLPEPVITSDIRILSDSKNIKQDCVTLDSINKLFNKDFIQNLLKYIFGMK